MIERRIISLFLLLGSIVYLFEAQQLTFGTIESPKSGFLPLLTGIIALLLSLTLIVNQLDTRKPIEQDQVNWTKFLFVIIGLLFYIMFLNIIGYLSATFIFLFYLFKVADTEGWMIPLMMAGSSSAIFYLIFDRYLAVTLP
jgi:putative tricarboxylic transport membrane protein